MSGFIRSLPVQVMLAIVIGACASPAPSVTQSSSSDQVATIVAMTMQAIAPETAESPTGEPGASTDLLPHGLYFLAGDSQSINQIYRMERDGKTKTQLTFEPADVDDYDVSPADGMIAYEVSNQLVLANADGSNRRVLVPGADPDIGDVYHPAFSPDGQTLAYGQNGLNLYDLSTGESKLVIENQYGEPLPNGARLPIEIYMPERYSPDGRKLLVALGHWEVLPSHAVYDPETNALVRYKEVEDYIYCCSFHGGPVWSPDSTSFYGVASVHDTVYQSGELWKVDAGSGALTRSVKAGDGIMNLPRELYAAPDGRLYFFLGTYGADSGYFDAPVLELVRSGPDGVAGRTVLRRENFVLMKQALWAPDASFVIVVSSVGRNWDQESGVLELYYTDAQNKTVWLASSGQQLRWGP